LAAHRASATKSDAADRRRDRIAMNSRRFIVSSCTQDHGLFGSSTQAIKTGKGVGRKERQCGNVRCKNPERRMTEMGHSRRFKREVGMTASPQ